MLFHVLHHYLVLTFYTIWVLTACEIPILPIVLCKDFVKKLAKSLNLVFHTTFNHLLLWSSIALWLPQRRFLTTLLVCFIHLYLVALIMFYYVRAPTSTSGRPSGTVMNSIGLRKLSIEENIIKSIIIFPSVNLSVWSMLGVKEL